MSSRRILFGGLAANFKLFAPAVAEISDLQQKNAIKVAVEEDQITDLLLPFAKFDSVVTFGTPKPGYGGLFGTATKNRTGRAMVAELGPGRVSDLRLRFAGAIHASAGVRSQEGTVSFG